MRRFLLILILCVIGAAPVKVDPVTPEEALENWRVVQGMSDRLEPIEFPAGSISIGRPWNIHTDGIDVSGAGRDRTMLHLVGMQGPTIIHGVLPRFKDEGIQKSDFVDIKPLGDGTISGMAPRLHGGRVPLFLTCPMTAWSHAGWSDLRSLTLEAAYDTGEGFTTAHTGPICGVEELGRPRPINLSYVFGTYWFYAQTDDGVIHSSRIDGRGLKGVVRIAVQLDLNLGTIKWILNGQIVQPPEPFGMKPQSKLIDNDDLPFKFMGGGPMDSVPADFKEITDNFGFTLIGARLSNRARYDAQTMPRTDKESYRDMDANTIAMIPFDDDTDYVINYRVFRLYSGPASLATSPGCALLMGGSLNTDFRFPFVHRLLIRDMSIEGGGYYGMALALGTSLNTRIRDVRLSHASVGLGCFRMGSNYTTYLEGSNEFSGNVFGVHQDTCIFKQTGMIQFGFCGKAFVWAKQASMDLDMLFIPNTPPMNMEYAIRVGGSLMANQIVLDDEESVENLLMKSVIRCDIAPWAGTNELRIKRLAMAQVPPKASIVTLGKMTDNDGGMQNAKVDIGVIAVDADNKFVSVYNVLDPKWIGNMEATWIPKIADHVIASGKCNVRHTYSFVDEVPADKFWIEGCHFFEFPQRSSDNWRTARCTKTGRGSKASWVRTR